MFGCVIKVLMKNQCDVWPVVFGLAAVYVTTELEFQVPFRARPHGGTVSVIHIHSHLSALVYQFG
jgi:hypothetical protein